MIIQKIATIIRERRLPYFLEKRVKSGMNAAYFLKNRAFSPFRPSREDRPLITFKCGFHGETGGVFAIAAIANLLSRHHRVEFVTHPGSNYNKLLEDTVCLVRRPNWQSHLFICDVTCEHDFFDILKRREKKIIVSCHGFPDTLHGLPPHRVRKSLSYADTVHFVSQVQQEAFQLPKGKFAVVANLVKQIQKQTHTRDAGCVGNLNEPRKNAAQSVEIALRSKAGAIHLWSIDTDPWQHPRVRTHRWETDKDKIYNSFDVLVFMSRSETFGLVVIEAMSAGIPCLLSRIPAFRQFEGAPGVTLVDGDDVDKAAEELNTLLQNKDAFREEMMAHFEANYSEAAISKKWLRLIDEMLDAP